MSGGVLNAPLDTLAVGREALALCLSRLADASIKRQLRHFLFSSFICSTPLLTYNVQSGATGPGQKSHTSHFCVPCLASKYLSVQCLLLRPQCQVFHGVSHRSTVFDKQHTNLVHKLLFQWCALIYQPRNQSCWRDVPAKPATQLHHPLLLAFSVALLSHTLLHFTQPTTPNVDTIYKLSQLK